MHFFLFIFLFFSFIIKTFSNNNNNNINNQKVYEPHKKGLLVIPGLGRIDRLKTVVNNLKLLERDYLSVKNDALWHCIIYIYAQRTDTEFWNQDTELNYITSLCDIVENPNKKVTENLHMVQPFLINNIYEYVFILLDDCKLIAREDDADTFDLNKILYVMNTNNLTVASPMVLGANKGGGQSFRSIMQKPPLKGTEGYISVFVEIFAWVTTISAYQALWELLYPSVNPTGWGYDFWYNNYASTRVKNHKMGIISSIQVLHDQDFSSKGEGRTDITSADEKWKGVIDQEKIYFSKFGIDLKKCRENLGLSNSSWNGAVTGYLIKSEFSYINSLISSSNNENQEKSINYLDNRKGKKKRRKNRGYRD